MMDHTPRPDYVKCIFDERATNIANEPHDKRDPTTREDAPIGPNLLSWCGAQLSGIWCFNGIDHAANTIRHGSHMLPCPDCVAAFRKTFEVVD